MIGPTDYEIRLRRLEGAVAWITRMLRSIGKMARQGAEGVGQGQSGGFGGGTQIFRAIVTTAITAPSTSSGSAGSGFATIQVMDSTGAFATHPNFPSPVKVWNGWPGASTTATVGKVVEVRYDGQTFTMTQENCT